MSNDIDFVGHVSAVLCDDYRNLSTFDTGGEILLNKSLGSIELYLE